MLRAIFKDGLKCWAENRNGDDFEIRLKDSFPYEREGSLSLVFNVNGVTIYTISFTFCQGAHFGIIDEQIIYVSRIQGTKESLDIIAKSSKLFSDNTPPSLLLSTLEGIALSLGIKTFIGIGLHNQIGYANISGDVFQKNYDLFWKTYESVKITSGDYLISLPIKHKVLALIKSKHRSRTIAKRKVRQDISRKAYSFFMNEVLTGKKVKMNSLRVVKELRATA